MSTNAGNRWVKLTRIVADPVYGTVFWCSESALLDLMRALDGSHTRLRTTVVVPLSDVSVPLAAATPRVGTPPTFQAMVWAEVKVVETPMQILAMLGGGGQAT